MTYYTDPEKRRQIDDLLNKNASYQAANNCITNSKTKAREINAFCNREFLRPIKEIDPEFYAQIIKQND